jgi:hypothetical protein
VIRCRNEPMTLKRFLQFLEQTRRVNDAKLK